MPDPFPDDVRRFIADNLNSVEQLEVLLLLKNHPEKEWDADAVSQAVYSQPAAAAMRLKDLHARGLLWAREGSAPFYRYGPPSREIDSLINRVEEVYKERRVAVISLIYSKPHGQVQAFADAFKFRKDS